MTFTRILSIGLLFGIVSSSVVAAETSPVAGENRFGVSGLAVDNPEQLTRLRNLGVGQVRVDIKEQSDTESLAAFVQKARGMGLGVYAGVHAGDESSLQKIASIDGLTGIAVMAQAEDSADSAASFDLIRKQSPAIEIVLESGDLSRIDMELVVSRAWTALAVPLMGDPAADIAALQELKAKTQLPIWSFRVGIADSDKENLAAEAEAMRGIVYRTVQALYGGAEKVFWAQTFDADNNGIGLFAFDGRKMRMSYPAYRHLISRLAQFDRVGAVESGPDYYGYKFHQMDGQMTTVAWTALQVEGKTWNEHLSGKDFRIFDVCGSVINKPSTWMIDPEPMYYIENESKNFPRFTYGGLVPDEREFPYQRAAFPPAQALEIAEGWDWSLPEGVEPEPQSGFFNFSNQPSKDIRIVGWHPKWKDWHVGPGQYDFSSMKELLEKAHKDNFKVGIRLQSVVQSTVPEWLIQKYNPPTARLSSGQRLTVVAPWDDNVRREFEEFIREFGRQGFQNDPAFAWASIHGIGLALGEEFDLPEGDIRNLEKVAGLTEEKFRAWVLGRLNVWADAFGDKTYKLGWVGGEHFGGGIKGYNDVASDAVTLCLERGIGARGGFVEMYNYKWNERLWGSSRSEDGYMLVDENRFKTNLMMADENEEYLAVKRWRFGMLEEDPHRWRLSNLRAVQMRCNFLNTNSSSMDLDRQLTEYVRRELGRNIENTPDVWCYLREGYVKDSSETNSLPLKNFERWLLQRDLPGGMTQLADRIERTYEHTTDAPDMRHEFNARRTDIASGNRYIYFDVDDRYQPSQALVKVTYLDNADTSWALEYNSTSKADARSESVKGTGDGKVKTATFLLADAAFANKLEHGQDMRIVCDGPEDVTVHMVRIIRPPANLGN